MKLAQLVCLQVICKHLNMTRAAEELRISQPSLTRMVHELEEEFGLTLFLRQSRGLILTEEGAQFRDGAALLLEQTEAFSDRMKRMGRAEQTLDVGIPPTSGLLFLPKVLKVLQDWKPRLRLNIVESGSLSNRQKVLDGGLDAAFTSTREPVSAAFGQYLIAPGEIRYYTAAGSPLAGRTSVGLADIVRFPLAMVAEDCFLTSDLLAACGRAGLRPDIMLHTNQLSLLTQLVADGTAGTVLFGGALPPENGCVEVPVRELPPAQVYLIWSRYLPVTGAKERLVRAVEEAWPSSGALPS